MRHFTLLLLLIYCKSSVAHDQCRFYADCKRYQDEVAGPRYYFSTINTTYKDDPFFLTGKDFSGSYISTYSRMFASNRIFKDTFWDSFSLIQKRVENSDFTGSIMRGFIATNIRIENTVFKSVDFEGSVFTGSVFTNVDLSYSNLRYSDLGFTVFKNCNLENANLENSNLIGARFVNVKTNTLTKFPKSFDKSRISITQSKK